MKQETVIGTIGGCILSTFQADLFASMGMAAIGAATSFFVTMFLKWIINKIMK